MFQAVAALPDAGGTGKCRLKIGFRECFGTNPIRSDRLANPLRHRHVSLPGFAVEPTLVFRVDINDCSRPEVTQYHSVIKIISHSGEG